MSEVVFPENIVKDPIRLMKQLNLAFQENANTSVISKIVQSVIQLQQGGISTTIITTAKADSVTVISGSNTIIFNSSFSANTWIAVAVWMKLADNSLANLLDTVTNKTTTGFDVVTPEAGTLNYCVVPKT